LVADFLGIDRTSIYDWLRKYHQGGEEALDTRKAPGAPLIITPEIDAWLKEPFFIQRLQTTAIIPCCGL